MWGNLAKKRNPFPSRFAVEFALRHPGLALLLKARAVRYEDVLRLLVARDLATLRKRYNRLLQNDTMLLQSPRDDLQRKLRRISPSRRETPQGAFNEWYAFLYAASRSLRPRIVVESGVLYGNSSAAILQALEDNGTGRLVSIDLPPQEHRNIVVDGQYIQTGLPSALPVGLVVSPRLRSRWELLLGDSLEVLPRLLHQVAPISMFIHDSLHTYEHMLAEYVQGYGALERGGILVSDDIRYNSAWTDFCKSRGEHGITLTKGAGKNTFAFLVKS